MSELSARRAHTRDRLVDAAIRVFAARGIQGATVEEISETAGFTRGAFYSNFDDRDAICVAVLDRLVDTNMEAMAQAVASVEEPDAPVPALIERAVDMMLAVQPEGRDWVLASTELRLHAARDAAFGAVYADRMRTVNERVHTTVSAAIERIGLRFEVPTDEAIGVLTAIHGFGVLEALVSGTTEGPTPRSLYVGVLTALLRPAPADAVSSPSGR